MYEYFNKNKGKIQSDLKKLRKIKLIDVKQVFGKRPEPVNLEKENRFEDDEKLLYRVANIYSNFEDQVLQDGASGD